MSKKFLKILTTAAASAIILTGCVGAKKEEAKQTADPNAKVEITYWGYPVFTNDKEFPKSEDYDAALIKAFEAKYPNIKVNYQKIDFNTGPDKIETAIQSKSTPDIIYDFPGRIIPYAKKELLVALDNDTSKLNKVAVASSSVDGKLYMYPHSTAPFLMGVNIDLTDKLGISDLLPSGPDRKWSVEEFETFLRAVKEKDSSINPATIYANGTAGDQGVRALIANLHGSWTVNTDLSAYTINDEAGVKGMEWIKKAYDEGLLGNGVALKVNDSLESFKTGHSAISILLSPGLAAANAKDFKYRFLPFPTSGTTPKYESLIQGPAIFDNGDVNKIEAAKKFIDFMINDKDWGKRTLLATGSFSTNTEISGLYDTEELKYAESLQQHYGTYYNAIPGYKDARPLWFNMLQSVLNGDTSPKDGLDKFVNDADKTIKANK